MIKLYIPHDKKLELLGTFMSIVCRNRQTNAGQSTVNFPDYASEQLGVKCTMDANGTAPYGMYIEFDDEEAALCFKLTHL
jgi:hypothetical protein